MAFGAGKGCPPPCSFCHTVQVQSCTASITITALTLDVCTFVCVCVCRERERERERERGQGGTGSEIKHACSTDAYAFLTLMTGSLQRWQSWISSLKISDKNGLNSKMNLGPGP